MTTGVVASVLSSKLGSTLVTAADHISTSADHAVTTTLLSSTTLPHGIAVTLVTAAALGAWGVIHGIGPWARHGIASAAAAHAELGGRVLTTPSAAPSVPDSATAAGHHVDTAASTHASSSSSSSSPAAATASAAPHLRRHEPCDPTEENECSVISAFASGTALHQSVLALLNLRVRAPWLHTMVCAIDHTQAPCSQSVCARAA